MPQSINPDNPDTLNNPAKPKARSPWTVPFLVLALAIGGAMYRILVLHHLEQTSLLFVGIPVVLAFIVACTPRAGTVAGGVLKATALGLLLSGPLLGEGFICILMAAPIFFAVAMAIVGLVCLISKMGKKSNKTIVSCVVVAGLVPMGLEGTRPGLSFNREEVVTARRIVHASPDAVKNTLSQSQRLDLQLPFFLRLGFPHPTEAHGTGLLPGDLRRVHFAGGEGHPGDLVLKVVDAGPGYARFNVVSNETKVAHWLALESAEITWKAIDGDHTQVEWTLRYRRLLDPAWYFRPWERYAVTLAADYLIQTNAEPGSVK